MDLLAKKLQHIIKQLENRKNLIFLKSYNNCYTYLDLANQIFGYTKAQTNQSKYFAISENKNLEAYSQVIASLIVNVPFIPIPKCWPLEKKNNFINDYKLSKMLKNNSIEKQNPFEGILYFLENQEYKNTLAYIYSTSGSSGEPKLIKISRDNFYYFLESLEELNLAPYPLTLSQTFELSFDPSLADLFLTISNQNIMVALQEQNKYNLFEYIEKNNIHFCSLVPSLAQMNIERARNVTVQPIHHLKTTIFTGEELSSQLVDEWRRIFPNSKIYNFYGPTESTVWSHYYGVSENLKNLKIPIGVKLKNVLHTIHNGELLIGGNQLTEGYFNVEENKNRFIKDSDNNIWFKTGDFVDIDEENNLIFKCRKDRQIKIGGRRFDLSEIEYLAQQANQQVKLTALPLKKENKIIGTQVVFYNDTRVDDIHKIIDVWRKNLATVFIPKKFFISNKIPINNSHKIDWNKIVGNIENGKYKELEL
ncbi:MAG: AMP-binding protein [Bdellovibrionales bacterium]|nr:AMP-binding protein [Bdellovibrionales bacterium]